MVQAKCHMTRLLREEMSLDKNHWHNQDRHRARDRLRRPFLMMLGLPAPWMIVDGSWPKRTPTAWTRQSDVVLTLAMKCLELQRITSPSSSTARMFELRFSANKGASRDYRCRVDGSTKNTILEAIGESKHVLPAVDWSPRMTGARLTVLIIGPVQYVTFEFLKKQTVGPGYQAFLS